ncbi:hypothetical protein Hypma_006565 [Hypsizygus marmoreus]|uniref:Uncharacterized protein n=1 Tax=Hypsizygus marmoreus TaxID=39966 RepID=A0A369K3I6_HYPMA|nr:hypothetical protein Hypma_006565 [Hypsizygus marmoreus]
MLHYPDICHDSLWCNRVGLLEQKAFIYNAPSASRCITWHIQSFTDQCLRLQILANEYLNFVLMSQLNLPSPASLRHFAAIES